MINMEEVLKALVFGAGVTAQCWILVADKKFDKNAKENLRIFLNMIPFLLVLFGISAATEGETLEDYIFSVCMFLAWGFIAMLYRVIASTINEAMMLFWIMVLGYIAASTIHPHLWSYGIGQVYLLVLTLIILLNILKLNYGRISRLIFYLSYSIIVGGIGVYQFFGAMASGADLYSFFIYGITFTYLSVHAWAIIGLMPSKHGGEKEVADHAKTLISKFSNRQTKIKELIGLLLLVGGLIIGNLHFQLIEPKLFIALLIVLVPQGSELVRKKSLGITGLKF